VHWYTSRWIICGVVLRSLLMPVCSFRIHPALWCPWCFHTNRFIEQCQTTWSDGVHSAWTFLYWGCTWWYARYSLSPRSLPHVDVIVANGDSIASEGKGDYMFVEGRVMDTKGNPIAGAVIDTWETDGSGLYDTQVRLCTLHNHYLLIEQIQYADRDEPDCRGRLHSAEDGYYSFRAIVCV
jgi:hypothetical protein